MIGRAETIAAFAFVGPNPSFACARSTGDPAKLGISFCVTLDRGIEGAEKVGKHKRSMLQDVDAGRGPEIDALVGSVVELGRLTATPTPHIDSAYDLVKLLERTMEQEHGG